MDTYYVRSIPKKVLEFRILQVKIRVTPWKIIEKTLADIEAQLGEAKDRSILIL